MTAPVPRCTLRLAAARTTLVLMLLPLVFVRALIPSGFMPRPADSLAHAMELCPGHSDTIPGSSPSRPLRGHGHTPCDFTLGATSAPPPELPAEPAWLAVVTEPAAHPVSSIWLASIERAQSSRGPPSFS